MRTFDIISKDLKLWFSVDLCSLAEQQIAARLRRIGTLGMWSDDDFSIEYGVRGPIDDTLMLLMARAIRLDMIYAGMCVS